MKKTICKLIYVFFLGAFVLCPSMVVGHGGGGGGGGSEDGDDVFGGSSSVTEEYLMGGGVSWDPNPNGPGIRGSSVYSGRPENIEKGPYQSGTAIEDAEGALLAGYQSGNYTAAEVQEQLAWAVRVGIKISMAAQNVLDQINNPNPSSTQQWSQEEEDKAGQALSALDAVRKLFQNNQKNKKPVTAEDIESAAIGGYVAAQSPQELLDMLLDKLR